MFLKGFGYDQCEKDATKGSNPINLYVAKQQSFVQIHPLNKNKTLFLQCNNNVTTL